MTSPMDVAYQGERGAYGEEAVRCIFGEAVRPRPFPSFERVFEAVAAGAVPRGVVPIENSLAGAVHDCHDLLLRYPLHVICELELRVRHCFLARPGEGAGELKTVHSHPQALAQCAEFVAKQGLEPVPAYNTAGSARLLSEGKLPRGSAVIASRAAAEAYGLAILAEGVETRADNSTRFYALSQTPEIPASGGKTAISFTTHHTPGALHEALGPFARRGIDLARIESRPLRSTPWEYVFFVDLLGSSHEPELSAALAELKGMATSLRVLGSFPKR